MGKGEEKRERLKCVNHPPDTQMETACTKTVRLWKRLSPQDFAQTTPVTLTPVTLSVAGKLDKAERPM